MADPLEHDQATADAITAELVACTLGTRRRPELRVDLAGVGLRLAAQAGRMGRAFKAFGVAAADIRMPKLRDPKDTP